MKDAGLRRDSVSWSLAANLAGGASTALLTLVAVPVQVSLLGTSAVGLIALVSVLQVVMGAFDPGLAPLATRSVAQGDAMPRPLLRAMAWGYWMLGPMLTGTLWASSDLILRFRPPLDVSVVNSSNLLYIHLFLCLRWPVAFYAAILAGLQRMVLLNIVRSACLAGRLLGGIVLLLLLPDLRAFLGFMAITAAIELIIFVVIVRHLLPWMLPSPRHALMLLRPHVRFAAPMLGIGILSMVLTQADRVWIWLTVGPDATGIYSIAYTAGMAISLAQIAVNTATFPMLTKSWAAEDTSMLSRQYRTACQGMAICLAPPAMALAFFSNDILHIWVGSVVAEAAAPAASVLACGFLINAITSNAYQVAVVANRASIPLLANTLGTVIYLAILGFGVRHGGINVAACAWLSLNLSYLATLVPPVHALLARRDQTFGRESGALRIVATTAAIFAVAAVARSLMASPWSGACLAASAAVISLVLGVVISGDPIRPIVIDKLQRLLS